MDEIRYLGLRDVFGENSWRPILALMGFDPAAHRCITWHETREPPLNCVAAFRVRSGDPCNYIVPLEEKENA